MNRHDGHVVLVSCNNDSRPSSSSSSSSRASSATVFAAAADALQWSVIVVAGGTVGGHEGDADGEHRYQCLVDHDVRSCTVKVLEERNGARPCAVAVPGVTSLDAVLAILVGLYNRPDDCAHVGISRLRAAAPHADMTRLLRHGHVRAVASAVRPRRYPIFVLDTSTWMHAVLEHTAPGVWHVRFLHDGCVLRCVRASAAAASSVAATFDSVRAAIEADNAEQFGGGGDIGDDSGGDDRAGYDRPFVDGTATAMFAALRRWMIDNAENEDDAYLPVFWDVWPFRHAMIANGRTEETTAAFASHDYVGSDCDADDDDDDDEATSDCGRDDNGVWQGGEFHVPLVDLTNDTDDDEDDDDNVHEFDIVRHGGGGRAL